MLGFNSSLPKLARVVVVVVVLLLMFRNGMESELQLQLTGWRPSLM